MTREVEMGLSVKVDIVIGDESAILRCVENHDENGVPQPDVQGGRGWRNTLYALTTEREVLHHLADNCVRNGVEDASRLDGWGDLEEGVVTMRATYTDVDWVVGA